MANLLFITNSQQARIPMYVNPSVGKLQCKEFIHLYTFPLYTYSFIHLSIICTHCDYFFHYGSFGN